ncbi:uncharacterized protein Nmlp_2233 [Natronomonas moolapensis 8.8.11]|uniref:Uncharacterized protein n=1 Tax=Natronomonas moolapensis (strain DSM 18674 / CECT 7526 / JCM 14361 / 8.8.11) TaxID=268739 RepID=M1XKS1_NATM8|nr:DUF6517 family protein [Natronomonas moolapensis]CCQ36405.1 uncharacterized protein Nmlp_2233 [Natronomonas moolapensis 8.8.11]
MRRRTLLGGAVGIAASAAAGCLGAVGMDEYEATPAGVDPAVREETGYEQTAVEEQVIERTVDAGVSEEITVRNYLTEHQKGVDLGPIGTVQAATFTVFTSPKISIAGRGLNPIAGMSAAELIEAIESDSEGLSDVERVEDGEATVLGQSTAESLFEAEAELDAGVSVDVNLHVTESVETTDDHLVTIGVYPREVEAAEADNVAAMRSGVVERVE